jgi:hypothetical protein
MSSKNLSTISACSRPEEFRELCLLYTDYLQAEGAHVTAYDEKSGSRFALHSAEVQQKSIDCIRVDLAIFESMQKEGYSLRDSKTHLWRFLGHMKWAPQSDIFDKIECGDIVEVYFLDSAGQLQLFRNLRFLECVSYTIEDLYGLNWKIATAHDTRYEQAIFTAIHAILSQPEPKTYAFDPEPHLLQEMNSPKNFRLSTQLKYLSPICQNKQVVAMLCTNHTDVLS